MESARKIILLVIVLILVATGLLFSPLGSKLGIPAVVPSISQSFKDYLNTAASAPTKSAKPAAPTKSSGGVHPVPASPAPAAPQAPRVYGKGEVRIGSVYPSSAYYANSTSYASLTLYYSVPQGQSLDLTGWEVHSNSDDVFIPKAVGVYSPGGFASPGDIVVSGSGDLTLYSSASPIGQNVRLNECLGYLNNGLSSTGYRFPYSCPSLYSSQSDIMNFSPSCQDYIASLGSCSVPNFNNSSIAYDSACKQFLETRANYAGCFSAYQNQSGFLSNEWVVFLGDFHFLNRSHDQVDLYNQSKQLIDEYVF